MGTVMSRGAAAALFTMSCTCALALPLAAQGAVAPTRRDTGLVRMPTPAALDSIHTLMRLFEQEQTGSRTWVELRSKINALIGAVLPVPRIMVNDALMPRGSIGIYAQGLHEEAMTDAGHFIRYIEYPLIISVDPDSPAQRAGIAPGDLLLAYDGLDVVRRELNLTQLLVPEKKLVVTVRRDGETKDYPVTVAKATARVTIRRRDLNGLPQEINVERLGEDDLHGAPMRLMLKGLPVPADGPNPAVMMIWREGVFGTSLTTVNPDLAKALKLQRGVLVSEAPESSPGYKAGLRSGDVIVSVGGHPVVGLTDLQREVAQRAADRAVTLQVVRDKKPRKITVRW